MWIVQAKAYQDGNPERIVEILKGKKIPHSWVECIPFNGGVNYVKPSPKWHRLAPHYEPCDFSLKEPYFFYGTLEGFKQHGARPSFCDFNLLKYSNYSRYFEPWLFNTNPISISAKNVLSDKSGLFKFFGGERVFIRPDDNEKSFDGEVLHYDAVEEWYEHTQKYTANPELRCLVFPLRPIQQEWRVIVANGNFVTGSQYRLQGSVEIEAGCPKMVEDFASLVALNPYYYYSHDLERCHKFPLPVYCMDICLSGGRLYLVEIGSVHTCGLYACDLEKFVNAVEKQYYDFSGDRA